VCKYNTEHSQLTNLDFETALRIDIENIAKVISANSGKSAKDITDAMIERVTLNPEEAQSWGLVP
jgi:ATP-dependent protease ClpP protease subunit